MLADFTSAISFIKSWTEAYRRLPITHPPLFDQIRSEAALRGGSAPNTAATYKNANPTKPQTKLASATFKFSSSVIEQCLSQVHEISPFDFLSALFWTRIARLKPPKNDQTHSISICFDFRNMLKPALPLGYFGNALHFSKLSLTVKDMESSQLSDVAGLVHSHLAELEDKKEEIWSSMDWLESQREEGGKYRSPNCMYGSELTFVRMEHLILSSEHETEQSLMYAAKFGNNEKPIHVSCCVGNVDREGLIMVMPSPEGGLARTVTLMLAEEQLAELCEDQVIMQLQPIMLLTATKLSH
ncbi:hypothetical protein L6164_035147 [Bauhinia variegata]|nr:hypothetical protein L6164_035147 [Bauhinia variegata]